MTGAETKLYSARSFNAYEAPEAELDAFQQLRIVPGGTRAAELHVSRRCAARRGGPARSHTWLLERSTGPLDFWLDERRVVITLRERPRSDRPSTLPEGGDYLPSLSSFLV